MNVRLNPFNRKMGADSHELVSKVKELAVELGRTPSRAEFEASLAGAKSKIERLFKNYITLLSAAGLSPLTGHEGRRKIDASIFEVPIASHLENLDQKVVETPRQKKKTLIIPDTHFPFVHVKTLERLIAFTEQVKPDRIVQIGDLYDNLSHGKFPRSHNVFTPKQEMNEAHRMATELWAKLRKASPRAKCFQILGNHDLRPMKRILEAYPEAELFLDFSKWFKFDGVHLQEDAREELILDGVAYLHGYKSQLGQHRDHMLRSCVTGHSHLGGVSFRSVDGRVLWELNAGLLGDPESKGLSYTPQKITRWTLGWGFVDEFGPRFIPA